MALFSLPGFVILLRALSASYVVQPSLEQRSELPDAEALTPRGLAVAEEEEEASLCSHHERAAKFCHTELGGTLGNSRGLEADSATPSCPSFSPLPNHTTTEPICAKDQMPHCDGEFLGDGIRLTMDQSCLNGPGRLVAEGFLSQRECSQIMQLTVSASHAKAEGKTSPGRPRDVHVWSADTKWLAEEMPHSAATWAAAGVVLTSLRKVRRYAQAYFRLRSRLRHQYSRLECHAAPTGAHKGVENAGSGTQMESCRLQPNGSCAQPDHSSKLEHYGAVLFLNADFQGGHFVFVGKTASSIRASVRPKCGRAVIFAGDQPHGYLPLVGGRACRLVLGWRDAHGDAPRSASRTTRASRRRLGRSQGMRTKDLASRAFFVDRLRTSAPLTASTRILVVLAGMAPVALCYTCYFSYMFYFRYRWRR